MSGASNEATRNADREFAARALAAYHHVGLNEWRYDGTHAAGNEMLRTADIIMAALKHRGWRPAAALSNGTEKP